MVHAGRSVAFPSPRTLATLFVCPLEILILDDVRPRLRCIGCCYTALIEEELDLCKGPLSIAPLEIQHGCSSVIRRRRSLRRLMLGMSIPKGRSSC